MSEAQAIAAARAYEVQNAKSRERIAKIEAARDVKVARARSTDYLTLRGFLGAFAAAVCIGGAGI